MRSFSVVPDEPWDQLAIELIGSDQQLLMVINELFLNRAVKTFDVGVHLGSSRVGMPVSFVQASDLLIEVLHKLRVVIGKCDHVAPNTIEKVLHRVESSTLAGSAGFVAFGFSALGVLFPLDSMTVGAHFDGPATHLIGLIGDDP